MKLFVTGLCGRLGKAIAEEAADQGLQVVGIDVVPWTGDDLPEGIEFHRGSFEDFGFVEPLMHGCGGLIHTAGLHGGHLEESGLQEYLRVNVVSCAGLLEAALGAGIRRFALASTMEVPAGRDWNGVGATIIDENTEPRTDSAYSLSRRLVEDLGKEFARQHGVSVALLRLCGFGWMPDAELGPRLLARTLPSRDVGRAMICAVQKDGLVGELFVIAPKSPLTERDMIAAFSDPWEVIERHYPGAAAILESRGVELEHGNFYPVSNISKAEHILGWTPKMTFDRWLKNPSYPS